MPVRNAGAQPPAAGTTAVAACHAGGSPGLVDEDEPFGIEAELTFEPCPASLQDVGAALLGGVSRLCLRVIPWRSKKRHSVPMPTGVPRSASRP